MTYDPRYFTTYYAIDAVNFEPVDLSSALDTIEGPYLPLIVQEAAGLPLDPSFAEQKRILERCKGLFYGCAGGAEARRFNRLLIDAGLIKSTSPSSFFKRRGGALLSPPTSSGGGGGALLEDGPRSCFLRINRVPGRSRGRGVRREE